MALRLTIDSSARQSSITRVAGSLDTRSSQGCLLLIDARSSWAMTMVLVGCDSSLSRRR